MFRAGASKAPELRYYLYISDAKLDMLFDQIDRSILKRIVAEVKVDLKLASVTLRGADSPGPSRAAKLRVVERYIEANHHVGDIWVPGRQFFRGRLEMWWGWVPAREAAVWFQNIQTEGSPCVVLVGSRYHVLGESRMEWVPNSALPSITVALENANVLGGPQIPQAIGKEKLPADWLTNVWFMWGAQGDTLGLPSQWVDFLAVPLVETQFEFDGESTRVVLATPLYVALAP
jgi:Family of unknown function (DUF7019)